MHSVTLAGLMRGRVASSTRSCHADGPVLACQAGKFADIYLVYELMDTDLHQIIRSPQPLSDEHVQYFIYQARPGLQVGHRFEVWIGRNKPNMCHMVLGRPCRAQRMVQRATSANTDCICLHYTTAAPCRLMCPFHWRSCCGA